MTDEPLINPHRSPTLRYCEQEGLDQPDEAVACVDCPAGIWHRFGSEKLICFCTLFHRDTWAEGIDAILQCDGREAAIAKLVGVEAAQPPR